MMPCTSALSPLCPSLGASRQTTIGAEARYVFDQKTDQTISKIIVAPAPPDILAGR